MDRTPPHRMLRQKTLENLNKHIIYSSDYERYSKSLLSFLRKSMHADTVFLVFCDANEAAGQNPLVHGRKLPRQAEQAIATRWTSGRRNQAGEACKNILFWTLSAPGKLLGLVGAVFPPRSSVSPAKKFEFRFLCDHMKKDFYFVHEQMIQKQRLADLDTLYQISKAVSATLNLDKLLSSILEAAKKLMNAEACSLAVADPVNRELTFTVAKGPSEKTVLHKQIKLGQGILGKVAENGKPLLVGDVRKDKRFFAGMDRTTGFTTRSVLCVPMKLRNNIIGAIEVLNPVDRTAFDAQQIPTLEALAQEAAVSIENARLFHLATTDGLTGLATIRYFRTLLEYEMSRHERYEHPLALIMVDIDHFKRINDSYGHLAGDTILRELANLIRRSIRQVDIPARYGGEEFIIMLPEASQKEAVIVAERLRKTVCETKIADEDRSYSIAISLGVAAMARGDQPTALIERADQQLYQAKQTGRNRVCAG